MPLDFIGIVAQCLVCIEDFSYNVIRSNDSICGFNEQEHNGCADDMREHFGCLGVTRPSTDRDLQLKEMTRYTTEGLFLI